MQNHDRRRGGTAPQFRLELIGQHAAQVVGRKTHDVRASQPEQAGRTLNRAVPLIIGKNAKARSVPKALLFNVPAVCCQQRMACRGKAGHVRHLAAADECEARRFRDPQNLLQPAAGDLFHDRGCGSACIEGRILIPSRGKPISRQCRWQRASDHPSPKASAGRTEDAAIDIREKFGNYPLRRNALFGELLAEPFSQGSEIHRGCDRGAGEIFEMRYCCPA